MRIPRTLKLNEKLYTKLKILASVEGTDISTEMEKAISAHVDKNWDSVRTAVNTGILPVGKGKELGTSN